MTSKTGNKIKAFTLVELVITLILASIIVGLGYGYMVLFQKHIHTVLVDEQNVLESQRFYEVLDNDYQQSYSVNLDLDLSFYQTKQKVIYQFYDDYTIRYQDGFTDTFKVVVSFIDLKPTYHYKHLPKRMAVYLEENQSEEPTFILFKNYEAELLFKNFIAQE